MYNDFMDTNEIDNSGLVDVTRDLQKLIDLAADKKEVLRILRGRYLISSIFLRDDSHIHFEDGAVLIATTDEKKYPLLKTRVAGIEMDWFGGLVNINSCKNVKISGKGQIDGQGSYWWKKFWGPDKKGGMLASYQKQNLRWACDYDCMRVRGLVVMESRDVELWDFDIKNSGFWNLHICYSENIHVKGITIHSSDLNSPSTDGIDIDSSCNVLVENVETHCHDDSICIKSGRDMDGLRVSRPCHHIQVINCRLNEGYGITLGSEVSGGIHHITFKGIKCQGTECGFRIKSSINRSGYIRDIKMEDVTLEDVAYPIYMMENWYPAYSICSIPEGYSGNIPDHWKKLCQITPGEYGLTKVEDLEFSNMKATYTHDFKRDSHAFTIEGFQGQSIKNVTFNNVDFPCSDFGSIKYAEKIQFKDSKFPPAKDDYSQVETVQLD